MNFMVRVGKDLDWPNNDFCLYQYAPVPKGATKEYHCEKLLLGHVVSINKTRMELLPEDFMLLMLHEVQVFGFKPGEENGVSYNLNNSLCDVFVVW